MLVFKNFRVQIILQYRSLELIYKNNNLNNLLKTQFKNQVVRMVFQD